MLRVPGGHGRGAQRTASPCAEGGRLAPLAADVRGLTTPPQWSEPGGQGRGGQGRGAKGRGPGPGGQGRGSGPGGQGRGGPGPGVRSRGGQGRGSQGPGGQSQAPCASSPWPAGQAERLSGLRWGTGSTGRRNRSWRASPRPWPVAHHSVGSPVYYPSCLAVTWCPWFSALSGSTVLLVTETMLLSQTNQPSQTGVCCEALWGPLWSGWLLPTLKGPGPPRALRTPLSVQGVPEPAAGAERSQGPQPCSSSAAPCGSSIHFLSHVFWLSVHPIQSVGLDFTSFHFYFILRSG